MTETKEETPNEVVHIEEPTNSEEQITREQINEKIKFYWAEVGSIEGWDKYVSAWKSLDYYRDLKQKLYK